MAKVYLFRKIEKPSDTQNEIYEEAINAIVDHVLKGSMGTIFFYGDPLMHDNECCVGAHDKMENLVSRVVSDIFKHVYTMELNMEIDISIKYYEFCVQKQQSLLDLEETHNASDDEHKKRMASLKNLKEYFVSTPKELFTYVQKKLKRFAEKISAGDNKHVMFVIHVKQNNLEKSKKFCGKLNLVHFMRCTEALTTLQTETNMSALLKIINALANNYKTHMRYHNIRLTHILKTVLGHNDNTVIINYIECKNRTLLAAAKPSVMSVCEEQNSDYWKDLYKKEHGKYKRLKEKVSNIEILNTEQKFTIDELIERLEDSSSDSDVEESSSSDTVHARLATEIEHLCAQLQKKNYEIKKLNDMNKTLEERCLIYEQTLLAERDEHETLNDEMEHIQQEVDITTQELDEVHNIIDQLSVSSEHTMDEIEKKTKMIDRLNGLLIKTTDEMIKQKTAFKEKLTEFSDIFTRLWHQQTKIMLEQEKQREEQLNEVFGTLCCELKRSHDVQLNKLKQQANKHEVELMKLNERHKQMVFEAELDANKVKTVDEQANKIDENIKK